MDSENAPYLWTFLSTVYKIIFFGYVKDVTTFVLYKEKTKNSHFGD